MFALIPALLVALGASVPSAAPSATPSAADAAARARDRAIAAYAQLKAGDVEGAIAGFKASSALAWRRSNDCNIGTAYLVAGQRHRAWFFLDRCRRRWDEGDPPGEPPRPLPAAIEQHLARLTVDLAHGHRMVEIVSRPPGARVQLDAFADDEPIATPTVLYLPNGPIFGRATLPGYAPTAVRIEVGPEGPTTVTIDLDLDPDAATRRLMTIRRVAQHAPERARAQWETLLHETPASAITAEDRLFAADLLARSGRRDDAIGELLRLAGDAAWSARDRAAFMLRVAELHAEEGRARDALIDIDVAQMLIADIQAPVMRDALARLRAQVMGRGRAAVRLACDDAQIRARLHGRSDTRPCGGVWGDLEPDTVRGEVDFEGQAVPFVARLGAGDAARVEATIDEGPHPAIWALVIGAAVGGGVAGWRYLTAVDLQAQMGETRDEATWHRLDEASREAALQGDIALGTSAALTLGAALWWLIDDDAPRVTVTVQPAGAGALEWRGRF